MHGELGEPLVFRPNVNLAGVIGNFEESQNVAVEMVHKQRRDEERITRSGIAKANSGGSVSLRIRQ